MSGIELTKEEAEALVIQIDARLVHLRNLQKEAGYNGNVNRVLELEKHMKPIESGRDKLYKYFSKL